MRYDYYTGQAEAGTGRTIPIPARATQTADLGKHAMQAGVDYQKNGWMRRIRIVFTSKAPIPQDQAQVDIKKVILSAFPKAKQSGSGNSGLSVIIDTANTESEINLKISGTKKLALAQDSGVIELNNISYETIILIQSLKLYRVEIFAGYLNNQSLMPIFKGEVAYISQQISSRRDSTLYITYASEMLAAWSQSRINFSIRGGVNLYAMFNYLMQDGTGVNRAKISPELKNMALTNMYNDSGTRTTIIENALKTTNSTWLSSASSLDNTVINISTLKDKRLIEINPNTINIVNGNPIITSQGLNISIFPVINLFPGDIIKIDRKLLDASTGMASIQSVQETFNTNYIDPDGCYIIKQLDYVLENRGQNFIFKIQAQSVNIFKGLVEG